MKKHNIFEIIKLKPIPLVESYLMTTKKINAFFNALQTAQAPPKFTTKFLEQLDFKTTSDRLFIAVLKSLKFIDSNGIPLERYYKFIDQTQSKTVLAEAIREGYSDLFALNIRANELSQSDVKNKLKTLFQGTKSDDVLSLIAGTFIGLCSYADFSKDSTLNKAIVVPPKTENNFETENRNFEEGKMTHELVNKKITTEMHYNIQIHLPETREIAVYDAIFKSLKEHLL
jgi:Family of unknown function (DUF5343)